MPRQWNWDHRSRLQCWPDGEFYFSLVAFRATRRSLTKSAYSRWRDSSSGWRKSDEGCTVVTTLGAIGEASNLPRSRVTRKEGPKIDCAAGETRQTTKPGLTRR